MKGGGVLLDSSVGKGVPPSPTLLSSIPKTHLVEDSQVCLPSGAGANRGCTFLAGEVQDRGSVRGVLLHLEEDNAARAETPDTPGRNH